MQLKAWVIGVGDELVLGSVVETNCRFAAQLLTAVGVRVRGVTWVRDEIEDISRTLKKALLETDVVVVSGGLGPTTDDLTREGLAAAIGLELEFRQELLDQIEARYAALGQVAPEASRRQAVAPRGARCIPNPIGVAPGLLIERGTRLLVLLPGQPYEFCHLMESAVLNVLEQKYAGDLEPGSTRSLLVTGVPESVLDERLREASLASTNPRLGFSVRDGAVTLRLVAHASEGSGAEELLDRAETRLRALLGPDVCEGHPCSPEEAVGGIAALSTVAVADAVTGGRLSSRLVEASVEVRGWVGTPEFLYRELPGLGPETGAVEAAAAAAGFLGLQAGVAVWPGEGGFLFVAASLGERAYERVVVPIDDETSNRRRCVAMALDLLRRLALGLPPPPESGEIEALAALAEGTPAES